MGPSVYWLVCPGRTLVAVTLHRCIHCALDYGTTLLSRYRLYYYTAWTIAQLR